MKFSKYHGAGNDFILINDPAAAFPHQNTEYLAALCAPHTGIGADGLLLIRSHPAADFEMLYFNADGRPGSFCGNGGRCAAAFAHSQGLCGTHTRFAAFDGLHTAEITPGSVRLSMGNVAKADIRHLPEGIFLNTGSPHLVVFTPELPGPETVFSEGRALRYGAAFAPGGTNVNFVSVRGHNLHLRTYERGVEAETLSCGTGVTASALAYYLTTGRTAPEIHTQGGVLSVQFSPEPDFFTHITLTGPVARVFEGSL